jgi:hypothetical protein
VQFFGGNDLACRSTFLIWKLGPINRALGRGRRFTPAGLLCGLLLQGPSRGGSGPYLTLISGVMTSGRQHQRLNRYLPRRDLML